ncbi:(subtelomeric) ABC-transporter protein family member, putative [Theileria annulata]|uniref:(Subtelomeric) ABC-transporter protein family member, putative n=1 Tax=Theileria annulata TaxID=5874 RepID=Q4UHH5_THEAN|nr:(subtelomeric) ABC-transporter protein family member, putative [Theileria annulata]CAI73464.1 (subtelomeric) ABC-transporter protein family member, putative [Theileria annulata]|eukprot:XP_954141.1 (subtelomeric) ABC-transporter protein family member, putative [Theileria annulata]
MSRYGNFHKGFTGSKCYSIGNDSTHHYWKSESYSKTYFKKNTFFLKFRYYDTSSVLKYLFFHWVAKWAYLLSKQYVEPYKLHPLPVGDQVLHWYPIFSKHISDGMLRLESYETRQYGYPSTKPSRSVLLRALLLTFWKRTLFGLLGIVVTNVLSMSIAILIKHLLTILNTKSFTLLKIFLFLFSIIGLQIVDGLLTANFFFYLNILRLIWEYSVAISLFQHGLSHRRNFFNNINGSNFLNVCNSILHSCSPDSDCSKNPLFCPARRYQNKDITPNMFTFESYDCYYVSLFIESAIPIVNFLSNFIYGIILISTQIKINVWVLFLVGSFFTFMLIVVEIINTFMFHFVCLVKDYRISECIEIISELPLINKLLYDDIAINIITETRNSELLLILVRMFLTAFNKSLCVICNNLSFFVLMSYFVKSVRDAEVITEIDTAGFLSSFYIYFRIINSMFMLPSAFAKLACSYVSYNRVNQYLTECSPNFYISDNKFTGSTNMSSEVPDVTNDIDKDVVVLYKDASFSWVNNRKDFVNMNNEVYLKKVKFQLKSGEIAIITGSQGCGKSNFIKSVLGEMTLVSGCMAVVPLHTSMPIFYASEYIWLKEGTIRSNITFGHRFDEDIYNDVLKAIELESDISSWEKGDFRVISDNAHSLSCGQRVRMEMARAIYAYLIFSKVNKDYNCQCSFLMCLDSQFHGLDPYVSRKVFHNLFNAQTGLLVKDDLAVILSSSLTLLNKCIRTSDLVNFPNIPIYEIENKSLYFHCYLSDVFSSKKTLNGFEYITSPSGPYKLNFFTNDMLKLCYSTSIDRYGRRFVTKSKYKKSFNQIVKTDHSEDKFNPYLVYFKAAGFTFILFIIFSLASSIMDNSKFILATNLTDYISNKNKDFNDGLSIDFSEVKSHSNSALNTILIIVNIIIVGSLLSTLLFTLSSLMAAKRIHEYCLNSVFKNSSSVIKIKKQINQIITYFSSDIIFIDQYIGDSIYIAFLSFIQTIISIGTLFYTIPLSIPFIFISLVLAFEFAALKIIKSFKNIQLGSLETMSHVNSSCEDAMLGSQIYRSFKKEWELVNDVIERNDYKSRCWYLVKGVNSWIIISFNWLFSLTTALFLTALIIFDKFTTYKMNVGYFGLGLSLSSSAIKSFNNCSFSFARLQVFMCSARRFQCFIPPGTKCIFDKFRNVHEEDIVINSSKPNLKMNKKSLLKRRVLEFKETKPNLIKRMMFRPKINFTDICKYLPSEHSGVVFKHLCVYTSSQMNEEGLILNDINASPSRSDIIGIIGRTGAGKTTLLSVLQNTIRYRSGQVLLDGRDLQDIPKSVIRHIIGVLPQLPFVFKGWTIRRFLDPRRLFSDDEINDALDNCDLLEFVNNLHGGRKLDTIIMPKPLKLKNTKDQSLRESFNKGKEPFSEESSVTLDDLSSVGTMLSVTQLRTLWFAKLVLYRHQYRMLIIDEPPSDNCSEHGFQVQDIGIPIYQLLDKYFKHCTCFVTAHYAKVLKSCTSVWVMHNGKLIKTCKASEVSKNESISNIIEEMVNKYSN